jgi:hypothetical protein
LITPECFTNFTEFFFLTNPLCLLTWQHIPNNFRIIHQLYYLLGRSCYQLNEGFFNTGNKILIKSLNYLVNNVTQYPNPPFNDCYQLLSLGWTVVGTLPFSWMITCYDFNKDTSWGIVIAGGQNAAVRLCFVY